MARVRHRQINSARQAYRNAEQRHFDLGIVLPGAVQFVDQSTGEKHAKWARNQNDYAISEANFSHRPAVDAGKTGGDPGKHCVTHDGVDRHSQKEGDIDPLPIPQKGEHLCEAQIFSARVGLAPCWFAHTQHQQHYQQTGQGDKEKDVLPCGNAANDG